MGDCEETGEERARVCIVPLQGSRCCGPHSGEDPGVGGMEKIRKGPCEQLRPYTSTNLLAWVIWKHACHRPSPSANLPQEEDSINCRHKTHRGARMTFLASFFICSSGESGPGLYWDRSVGKCLVMLGAGYTVFPKHDSLRHLNQGLPCPTSREEVAGEP